MTDYAARRDRMIERDILGRGIRDTAVIEAMRRVPREEFVPPTRRRVAYDDAPLPIGRGQTISQPYIVALMLEALELGDAGGDETALDVGTGSGYAAAILSLLVDRVYSIERHRELAGQAAERFERLGYDNIEVRHGDGSRGWPERAPFAAILVSAAAPTVPPALKEQLAPGGRLVVPVAESTFEQRLLRVTRVADDRYDQETLTAVRFVPLVSGELKE
ncbi:MAG: protein-L-isoaspartate(D-aspartate) O-methyltransferase [Gemmatimonadota bacterium]